MNAATLRPNAPPPSDPTAAGFKSALIASGILHVMIFAIAAAGIPFIAKDTPPMSITPISVELVTISDVTTTNRVAEKRREKEPEIEKPTPPKATDMPRNMAEQPPDLLSPKPPEPKEKPEPEKAKPPEPIQEVAKDQPKPKPKPKPPEAKTKPKPKEDPMQSLLRNIIPDEGMTKEETDESKETDTASGDIAKLANKLTMSETDAFKHQLSPCWNVPAGAEYAENLAVEIRIAMNPDMTMRNATILDQGRYNRDPVFKAAADSAMRALRNPRCSPFKLPPDKYAEWKSIVINFNPKDML